MELTNYNLAEQAEAGFDLKLRHPVTDETLDGVITIRGDESKAVQRYNRQRFVEIQRRDKNKNAADYTPAEYEDMNIENAIVRVISWKNIKKNGEDLPFTKENATEIFRDYPWIRAQVTEASADLLNFQPSGT